MKEYDASNAKSRTQYIVNWSFNEPDSPFETLENRCRRILDSFHISVTDIRLAVLKEILLKEGNAFTVVEISEIVVQKNRTNLRTVTFVLTLFKVRGLLQEIKSHEEKHQRGRPKIKFMYKSPE